MAGHIQARQQAVGPAAALLVLASAAQLLSGEEVAAAPEHEQVGEEDPVDCKVMLLHVNSSLAHADVHLGAEDVAPGPVTPHAMPAAPGTRDPSLAAPATAQRASAPEAQGPVPAAVPPVLAPLQAQQVPEERLPASAQLDQEVAATALLPKAVVPALKAVAAQAVAAEQLLVEKNLRLLLQEGSQRGRAAASTRSTGLTEILIILVLVACLVILFFLIRNNWNVQAAVDESKVYASRAAAGAQKATHTAAVAMERVTRSPTDRPGASPQGMSPMQRQYMPPQQQQYVPWPDPRRPLVPEREDKTCC